MGVERISHGWSRRFWTALPLVAASLLLAREAGASELRAEVVEDKPPPQLEFVLEVDEIQPTAGPRTPTPRPYGEPGATLHVATEPPRQCGVCDKDRLFDLDPWPWEAVFDPVCAFDEALFNDQGSNVTDATRLAILGGAATLVPAFGVRLGREPQRLRPQFSWPWSLPIGPPMAMTRSEGTCRTRTYELKPVRLMLEPGLAFTSPTTLFVRPGARFVFHPVGWRLGVGGGLGSTLEARGPWGMRASLSPELLLHWGRCCEPGFVTLTLRYDRFFSGDEKGAVTTGVGFSFY